MSDVSSNSTTLDIPRRCGQCGYELKGLATDGICPECGRRFDSKQIILFGWSASGSWATLRPGAFGWSILRFLLLIIVIIYMTLGMWRGMMILLAPMLSIAAWQLWKRVEYVGKAPAPLQVLLSRHGFGQRGGPGAVQTIDWSSLDEIRVRRPREGMIRLQIVRHWMGYGIMLDVFFASSAETAHFADLVAGLRDGKLALSPGPMA